MLLEPEVTLDAFTLLLLKMKACNFLFCNESYFLFESKIEVIIKSD